MKRYSVLWLVLLAFTGLVWSASTGKKDTAAEAVSLYYRQLLDSMKYSIWEIEQEALYASPERMQELFVTARQHYKQAEFVIEYFFPVSAQKMNGPALLEAASHEPQEPEYPSGFQVMEESVYGLLTSEDRQDILHEAGNLLFRIRRLEELYPEIIWDVPEIFDAVRLNIYRLITKGITGFDAPVSFNGVKEALPTLHATSVVLSFFPETRSLRDYLLEAAAFIETSGYEFNTFDRVWFITRYLNPFCIALWEYQVNHRIPFIAEDRAISTSARTLFDRDAFDVLFFAPSGTAAATEQQIALGKKLFHDPILSHNNQRSCASCHIPEKAFTDGKKINHTLSGDKLLLRNTPTLWNAAFQPVQFYDSRISFLEDQIHDVISNKEEMGGVLQRIAEVLNKDTAYQVLFLAAYEDTAIGDYKIKQALASYIRSLVALNSPFDRYMRGEYTAMKASEIRGLNLFMGKAKCATCHFIPFFSGAVPPLYDKMENEVLGIPVSPDTTSARMDTDSGKYALYGIPHHLYSFKTTTVRNAALTAPYMHNGVFKTLEEVVDFYNRGGGAGLGFDLPHQTLPSDKLHLSPGEQEDLVAFMRALTDTVRTF